MKVLIVGLGINIWNLLGIINTMFLFSVLLTERIVQK